MTSSLNRINAIATDNGLAINGVIFDQEQTIDRFETVLGVPSRAFAAGPPAPAGHRNNHVHVYDSLGIYLTEHHASRLIQSVNFIFDAAESLFAIERAFCELLEIDGRRFHRDMREADLVGSPVAHDYAGEYSSRLASCWIGISTIGRRGPNGKRSKPRFVVRVSICFSR